LSTTQTSLDVACVIHRGIDPGGLAWVRRAHYQGSAVQSAAITTYVRRSAVDAGADLRAGGNTAAATRPLGRSVPPYRICAHILATEQLACCIVADAHRVSGSCRTILEVVATRIAA
jgi:hypothetical protein